VPARILIEGRPGSGKTTAVTRLAALLRNAGTPLAGFLTAEIREGRRRVGFEIESLAGERATLAHVDFTGPPRVGKYGVDLDAFEALALPGLRRRGGVVIVDELGKMELASERFRNAIESLLERDRRLVATVHAFRHPYTDSLKARPDLELVRLTARNRDTLPDELAARLIG
jgi:nucleoside-triphosphatase